jgi:hypothetical protein
MTVVSPVLPPAKLGGQPDTGSTPTSRTLPIPSLPAPRSRSTLYGLSTVDCRGRIADRTVIDALGWRPGNRLDIGERFGAITIAADPDGLFGLTTQGHLRLPVAVRRWHRLSAGVRVLLAAEPLAGLLMVYPPIALDRLLPRLEESTWGGEAS